MFIAMIFGDQSQIMPIVVFFPLKSAPRVLILLENINIFAICDQSEIMECSGTGHIIWETGHTNLWPVLRDCVHMKKLGENFENWPPFEILKISRLRLIETGKFHRWTQSRGTGHRLVWPVSQIMWPVLEHSIICDQSQIEKMLMFSSQISTAGADFRGKNYYRHNLRLFNKYYSNKQLH